jgi:hypothetical protein
MKTIDRFHDQPASRAEFRRWLMPRREQVRGMSVPEVMRVFGRPVNWSAAYRVMIEAGLKGNRRNRSRYETFWAALNWHLPDLVLANVWKVDRGNLQKRRTRLNLPAPRWRLHRHAGNPFLEAAIQEEKRKARRFRGPRPARPAPRQPKTHGDGPIMSDTLPLPVRVDLQRDPVDPNLFTLTLCLIGADDLLWVEVADSGRPQITRVHFDSFELRDDFRILLVEGLYRHLSQLLDDPQPGESIQWLEPDLRPWLRQSYYGADASRLARFLGRRANPRTHVLINKTMIHRRPEVERRMKID